MTHQETLEPADLDVIGAESIQTGDFIQFSMTMAGDVSRAN